MSEARVLHERSCVKRAGTGDKNLDKLRERNSQEAGSRAFVDRRDTIDQTRAKRRARKTGKADNSSNTIGFIDGAPHRPSL